MSLSGLLTPAAMALAMLSVALLLAFVRLARGPSLPDRVIALDLVSILAAAIAATYAIAAEDAVFLDVAIVLALISFLGTVAFARFVERQGFNE
ncbi:MAG TPA: monovalent cation/H+ antiporter complex subunit F [Candidatus Binatia bacterium]